MPICAVDEHCESGLCYRPAVVDGFAEKGVCVESCLIKGCDEGLSCVADPFTFPDTSYVCAPTDSCVENADICQEVFDCETDDQCMNMGFEACFKAFTVDGLAPTGVCVYSAMARCLPGHTAEELPGSAPDVAFVCVPPIECTETPFPSILDADAIDGAKDDLTQNIPDTPLDTPDGWSKAPPRDIGLPGYMSPGDCGDGKINGGESCDGADLGGKSCKSWNLVGTLSCSSSCTFDFGACVVLKKIDFQ